MSGPAMDIGGLRVSSRSYWLDEALRTDPGAPCPGLTENLAADVCIVGGGFAGLWTAYELSEREPSLQIVLLEADICGSGGSGANGGMFSGSWHDINALCHYFGEAEGIRYATLLADQLDEVEQWTARHKADIAYHRDGMLFAQAEPWQAGPNFEAIGRLAAHGLPDKLRAVDAAAAQAVAASPRFCGGTLIDDLAVVQPARLARELRRVLLERGVRIFEGTPMLELQPGVPAGVRTPRGQVRADQVVIAMGAWGVSQPQFSRAFFVATDFMVITEPIPDLLEQIGWTSFTGIGDSRENFFYLRPTDDGRIAIGGGSVGLAYGDRIRGSVLNSAKKAAVAANGLIWLFPQLRGVRFAQAWSGPMDLTAAFVPFFTSNAASNVHAGLGFSGHGLAATKLGGKTLASLVLRADDEWSRLPVVGPPLSQLPPEPLRWPLLQAVVWAVDSGDRAQEQGRRRGTLRGFVASSVTAYRESRRRR